MKFAVFVNTLAVTSTFAFCTATKSSNQDSSNDGKRNNARRGDKGKKGKKKTKNEDFPKNDGFLKTIPMGGSVEAAARDTWWLCNSTNNPLRDPIMKGGPRASWVKEGNIIDIKEIPLVEATVSMESEFCIDTSETQRRLYGNGIPPHKIGTFPIPEDDPAYQYYKNDDVSGCYGDGKVPVIPYIQDITVPRFPKYNEKPTCIDQLTIGITTGTGIPWHIEYAKLSASPYPNDPSTLLPFDECWGHPLNGAYHIHGKSWACLPDQGASNRHSPLHGLAIDGFGIYGPRSEHGKLVTNEDLDECHGHIHEIMWEGKKVKMFHYHLNSEFPFSLGCFRGTPVRLIENLATCTASELSVTSVDTMTEANYKTTCLGGNRKVTKE